MGSRLCKRPTNEVWDGSVIKTSTCEKVWDPDNMFFMLSSYFLKGNPKSKKKRIIGEKYDSNYLKVLNDDTKHNKKIEKYPEGDARGWGCVSWDTYGEFLKFLQDDMNFPDNIKNNFELPVYAHSYNWKASVGGIFDNSGGKGKELADRIKEIVKKFSDKAEFCEHAILMSPSGMVEIPRLAGEGKDSVM